MAVRAFHDFREDAAHGEIFRLENHAACADGGLVVRVAPGDHRQAAALGVRARLFVEAADRDRGVEDFDGVHFESVEHGLADAGAEAVVRVRGDREPACGLHCARDLGGGFAFHLREHGADAQEVAVRRGDFDAGDDEEAVHGRAVGAREAVCDHVVECVAGVVVGDGEAVEALAARAGDEGLRAAHSVTGIPRVAMKFELKRHARRMAVKRRAMQVARGADVRGWPCADGGESVT